MIKSLVVAVLLVAALVSVVAAQGAQKQQGESLKGAEAFYVAAPYGAYPYLRAYAPFGYPYAFFR